MLFYPKQAHGPTMVILQILVIFVKILCVLLDMWSNGQWVGFWYMKFNGIKLFYQSIPTKQAYVFAIYDLTDLPGWGNVSKYFK